MEEKCAALEDEVEGLKAKVHNKSERNCPPISFKMGRFSTVVNDAQNGVVMLQMSQGWRAVMQALNHTGTKAHMGT